ELWSASGTVTGLAVSVAFQSLASANSQAVNGRVPSGSGTTIAYGLNQANGLADCGQGVNNGNGSNGFDVQENAIAGTFVCNTFPIVDTATVPLYSQCPNTVSCPGTVPGNKFLQWLQGGLATRIYGCNETGTQNANGCTGASSAGSFCTNTASPMFHPNYW